MQKSRLLFIGILSIALALTSCAVPRATTRGARGSHAEAHAAFTMPYDAVVYLSPAGGAGAATSDFGTCSGDSQWDVVFRGLPWNPLPADEVRIGEFESGDIICFAMKTVWRGNEYWTTSFGIDAPSQNAFRDLDGSLGFRGKSIAERVTSDTWILHLDDGASFLYDDNDGDVLIRIRLEKAAGE